VSRRRIALLLVAGLVVAVMSAAGPAWAGVMGPGSTMMAGMMDDQHHRHGGHHHHHHHMM
jgi:hypothetical protein